MTESDRPNVLHPRAWALSDRRNRPPGGSRAFQMLQKAAHLPHGFAIWQDWAPYGSKSCPGLGMGSSLRKWCSGAGQMQVLAPQGSETALWAPKPSHRSTVAATLPPVGGALEHGHHPVRFRAPEAPEWSLVQATAPLLKRAPHTITRARF